VVPFYTADIVPVSTAKTYPTLSVKRSGGTSAVLKWLENVQTGKRIYLNYSLVDGETVMIRFRPGEREIRSDYFGKVWRAALRNSDIGEFYLLPATNNLEIFVETAGSPTMDAVMHYRDEYETADGTAS
jgi:hypothetical protein